jgi:hypothetical protein
LPGIGDAELAYKKFDQIWPSLTKFDYFAFFFRNLRAGAAAQDRVRFPQRRFFI